MKPLLLVGLGTFLVLVMPSLCPRERRSKTPQASSDQHDSAIPDDEPTPQPSPGVKPTVSASPLKYQNPRSKH